VTSSVVLDVTSGDTGEATVSPATLTFTPADWDTPQTVTVTGVDDAILDGDVVTTITIAVDDANSDDTYDPLADQTVNATTSDDDVAGFTVAETGGTSVSEAATTDNFTVVLDAEPATDVVITVTSADTDEAIASTHVPTAGADLLLGGDLMVSASPGVTATLQKGRTRAVVNSNEMMTGTFTRDVNDVFPALGLRNRLASALGENDLHLINATRLAARLFGDSIAANLFLVGYAWQRGYIPLAAEAIEKAIALNGVAVELRSGVFAPKNTPLPTKRTII